MFCSCVREQHAIGSEKYFKRKIYVEEEKKRKEM